MPADRPYTDAEHDAVCRALDGRLRDQPGVPMSVSLMYAADAVLDAAAPLIAARAATAARVPLLSLIEDLTDDGPCHYDHNGYCQGHSLDPRPCPHERAKRVLARAHATTEEEHHA